MIIRPATVADIDEAARIYDMVRNVVIPARTSVLTVVCLGSNPKSLVSISLKFIVMVANLVKYTQESKRNGQ